jgi:hypothetical protein
MLGEYVFNPLGVAIKTKAKEKKQYVVDSELQEGSIGNDH